MRSVITFVIKEFQQVSRDMRMLLVIFSSPAIQLFLLGYAASFDLNVIHTAVYDMDRSKESRDFIEQFSESGYFKPDRYVNNYEELQDLFDKGKISAGLVIREGFGKKINTGEAAGFQAVLDGSDSRNAIIINSYIQNIITKYSNTTAAEQFLKKGYPLPQYSNIFPEERILFNPGLKAQKFMVPNIMGLVLMTVAIALMAVAIVKERENGTLEQLVVTPLKSWQLILGKLIPYSIMSFVSMLGVLFSMIYWFKIPVLGSVTLLLAVTFLFLLSNLGIGLFVSTICKTQQQALMISVFLFQMPMIYFSGFAFPVENMPQGIQYFSNLIPLKYYITILRGIVLKGTGFYALWKDILIIFIIGSAIITASALRFKRRIEG